VSLSLKDMMIRSERISDCQDLEVRKLSAYVSRM
jgi:hypothetical protein